MNPSPNRNHTITLRTKLAGDRLTNLLRTRLLLLRDAYGLTDAAWARAAHLRQQDVSRFTTGKMAFPALDFLDELCRVFDRTLPSLLIDDQTPQTTGFTLTKVELELIVNLRGMDPEDRHAFQRLSRPRRGRGAK